MINKELIQKAIDLSISTNSEETTMTFCEMKNFDGWCMRVTVCRHSVCEDKERGEAIAKAESLTAAQDVEAKIKAEIERVRK